MKIKKNILIIILMILISINTNSWAVDQTSNEEEVLNILGQEANTDNTKEVEIVKSNNDVKVEVIKDSFDLAVNVTENIEGVTNICRELKEASIGIAKIKADLNIHIANLDFEDRNNDRKFQMWMKKTDYDLIKFKESSNSVRHTLDEYLKSINDTRREIMSIPTNTLNQSEIQYRTELLSDIKEIRKHISDLLIKLMEM